MTRVVVKLGSIAAAGSLAVLLFGITACSAADGRPSEPVPDEAARTPDRDSVDSRDDPELAPSELDAWAGPTDGTWEWGDVALGDPVVGNARTMGSLASDYEITVTGSPTFSTTTKSDRVTITSPLLMTRIQDLGYDQSISESERIFFETTERPESEALNETWGVYTDLECQADDIAVGESTVCSVSFTADRSAMTNSHWRINGKLAAAWPGQRP